MSTNWSLKEKPMWDFAWREDFERVLMSFAATFFQAEHWIKTGDIFGF